MFHRPAGSDTSNRIRIGLLPGCSVCMFVQDAFAAMVWLGSTVHIGKKTE